MGSVITMAGAFAILDEVVAGSSEGTSDLGLRRNILFSLMDDVAIRGDLLLSGGAATPAPALVTVD